MKKLIQYAIICSLILALSACKDEQPDCCGPEPLTFEGCFLDVLTRGGIKTEFHYNEQMQIVFAVNSGDTTFFEYENERISRILFEGTTAELSYYTESRYPNHVISMKDGKVTELLKFDIENDRVVKYESYIGTDTTVAAEILHLDYSGDALIEIRAEYFDENQNKLIEIVRADNITTDEKINPLAMDFAIMYLNRSNPFSFTLDNITQTDIYAFGNLTSFASSYTYNDKDYTLTSDIDIPGFGSSIDFTYTCFD